MVIIFLKMIFFNHNINDDIVINAKITDDDCLIQADAFNKTQNIDSIRLTISSEEGFCDSNHILCDNNGKQIRLSQSIPQSKKNNYSDEEKQAFKERRTDGLLYFTKIKNKIPLYFIDPTNIQDELSPKKNSILADVMKKVKASFEKDKFPEDYKHQQWRGKTRKDVFNNYLTMVENVFKGGHWRVIIGYDTMGTKETADDVLIFADTYDTADHNQDGYDIENGENFFWSWFDHQILPEDERIQPFVLAYPKEKITE